MGYFVKNVLAEGSEEMASDLINWAGDVLVAKDKSQWKQAIQGYMDQGLGEKEAFQLALKDQLIDMGMSGLGGGMSGGVMAGSAVAVNQVMHWADGGIDERANGGRPHEGQGERRVWEAAPYEGQGERITTPGVAGLAMTGEGQKEGGRIATEPDRKSVV